MKIRLTWDFNNQAETDYIDIDYQAHDEFAAANGMPTVIDLFDHFEEPEDADIHEFVDSLSDDYGYEVLSYEELDACNNDNIDNIITQQPQPINPMEKNMVNSTQTPNSNHEEPMNSSDLITQLFNQFTQAGGSPKVTEFKRHIDQLIKTDIKPLCGRTAKAADGTDWRSVLKARFGGRGAKWVKLSVSNIEATLDKFDQDGINTAEYRSFINQAGFAWIRFSGPRLYNGAQAAAFEVRTSGSTYDHPQQLHYINTADLDNVIETLDGTPHSKKLEVIKKADENNDAQTEDATDQDAANQIDEDKTELETVFEDFINEDDKTDNDNDDIYSEC